MRGFLLIKVKLFICPLEKRFMYIFKCFFQTEKITKVWILPRPIKEAFLTE